MAAPETPSPSAHSPSPPPHPPHANTAATCRAVHHAGSSGACWLTAVPTDLRAAAPPTPPRAAAIPRASRARVLPLLRPSCGPAEILWPARPFLAAFSTERSQTLSHRSPGRMERSPGGEDHSLRAEPLLVCVQ